jgi:hypothetical protein
MSSYLFQHKKTFHDGHIAPQLFAYFVDLRLKSTIYFFCSFLDLHLPCLLGFDVARFDTFIVQKLTIVAFLAFSCGRDFCRPEPRINHLGPLRRRKRYATQAKKPLYVINYLARALKLQLRISCGDEMI